MAGVNTLKPEGDQGRQTDPADENNEVIVSQPLNSAASGLIAATRLAANGDQGRIAAPGFFVVVIRQTEKNGFRPSKNLERTAPFHGGKTHPVTR